MIPTKPITIPDASGQPREFRIRPFTVGEIRAFEAQQHLSKIDYVRANLDSPDSIDSLDFAGLKQLEAAILALTYQTETSRLN